MGAEEIPRLNARHRRILLAVLAFGFVVRFSTMFWGIGLFSFDRGYYHPDEPKVVNYVRDFPESFWTEWDFRYSRAVHHALLPLYLPLKWVGELPIVQSAVPGSAEKLWAFLVCRFGCVVMGAASVWFVYASVRQLTGRAGPALLGAFVACLLPYAVLNSGLAATDVPLALMVIVVFYVYVRLADRVPDVRWGWYGLGCLAGIAIGVKYTAAFLGPALCILMIWRHRSAGCSWITIAFNLARLGMGTFLAFIIVMPHAIFRYPFVRHSIQNEMGRIESRGWTLDDFLRCYWTAFGWPGTVLILGAVALLAWKRPRGTAALTLFTLFFVLITARGLLTRYVITIAPLAAVAVGCAAALPLDANPILRKVRQSGGLALIAACTVLLAACLYGRYAFDTRSQVTRFVQENYPPDTTVYYAVLGTDNNKQRWRWAHFAQGEYPEVPLGKRPDLIIATTPPHELIQQDLEDDGRRFIYWRSQYRLEPPTRRWTALYNALATGTNDYRIVKRIPRTRLPIEFPGYPLAVYERKSD
jgi:hypothetical protein